MCNYVKILKKQVQTLLTEMDALKQQQTDASAQVATTLGSTNTLQENLADKVRVLNQALHAALQQRGYQTNDWLLLKVRYYLELAQINAHWSDQTETTVALLQEADALLGTLHDQRLFVVRQAITKEISQLQAAPQLDMTKILSQLDAAQSMVLKLSIKQSFAPLAVNDTTPPPENTQSTWRNHLSDAMRLLEKMVVVQHHTDDVQPLLTSAYESVLRENIRLSLQEAQWAVLRFNDPMYHLLLTQAILNVNRSFDSHVEGNQALLKYLDDLQKIQLIQQKSMPDESLLLLNQAIELKDKQVITPQTPVSGGGAS